MKIHFPLVAVMALSSVGAWADDVGISGDSHVPQFVHHEFDKAHQDLASKAMGLKKKLSDLESEKARVYAEAKAQTGIDTTGVDALKKYDVLVEGRYVNDKGEYERGLQVAQSDVDNINKLFQSYLSSTPLQGRVSAGQARRILAFGIDQLKDREKAHSSPSESNNSDLEIIACQMHQTEKQLQVTIALAGQLGLALNSDGSPVASKTAPSRSIAGAPPETAPMAHSTGAKDVKDTKEGDSDSDKNFPAGKPPGE